MSKTRVVVEEIGPGQREEVVEGRTVLRGQGLASLIAQFNGYKGEVEQPTTGAKFKVSLEPWRHSDPNSTWLDIMFETDQ